VLRISFKISSSCISTLLSVFLEVFGAVLEALSGMLKSCFVMVLSKWPEYQHGDGLSMLISVLGIRKIAR